MAKAARKPKAVQAVHYLIAVNKNSGGPIHIKCESMEEAVLTAKAPQVDWNYPIYIKLPSGEMHIHSQPNK